MSALEIDSAYPAPEREPSDTPDQQIVSVSRNSDLDDCRLPNLESLTFSLSTDDYSKGHGASFFSSDYSSSRLRFLESAKRAGARIESHQINALGPNAEVLYIDLAILGPENSSNALLVISGTHGVEGFAGSAIQSALFDAQPVLPADCTLYSIHGLNPYGMAHMRRFNEENVDLNRNFVLDPSIWQIKNPDYTRLDSFLNPKSASSFCDFYYPRAAYEIARFGTQAVKQAIATGQYEFPDGLFYGGKCKQESILYLENFVRTRLSNTKRLFGQEIHTGLGPFAQSSLLLALDEKDPKVAKLQELCPTSIIEAGSDRSVSYETYGAISQSVPQLLVNTEVLWVTQEVGTYSMIKVLKALRTENRNHLHGQVDSKHRSKQKLAEVFVPKDQTWRDRVIDDGIDLFRSGAKFAFTEGSP